METRANEGDLNIKVELSKTPEYHSHWQDDTQHELPESQPIGYWHSSQDFERRSTADTE